MIPCPICTTPFLPSGKRLYCAEKCTAKAYRLRKRAALAPLVIPKARPKKPMTVYECEACGTQAVGEQQCEDCGAFMRRVGYGGECPHCAEIITVRDLLGEEGGL